jgi:methylmalonyl-CoA mutase, N-terminal domain
VPHWNTISISGYHIREAGSTAAQEIAFTLANGMAYVQAAIDTGLDVDSFASQLSFFFNAHNNFLEEVAKFRAARRMWARIMREQFGAKDSRSWRLRFHTQTAGSTLTAQQPENNVVRVALQALAAVLGGTQSLHTNGRDEALALPTEESVQIALRTQQIIAHESGVADTIDPLAGSYYVEYLTDELEKRALDYIKTIRRWAASCRRLSLATSSGKFRRRPIASRKSWRRRANRRRRQSLCHRRREAGDADDEGGPGCRSGAAGAAGSVAGAARQREGERRCAVSWPRRRKATRICCRCSSPAWKMM